MTTHEKVNNILSQTFKISPMEAENDLAMQQVPTWDSLTHMELITAIESNFQIQLTGDDIADMLSFGAVRKTVDKYTGK